MQQESSEPPEPASVPADAKEAKPPVPAEPAEDWPTRYKYLLADFENYRKRAERDRGAAGRQAEADLLRRLVPLVEGFDRARAAAGSRRADDPLRRGLELLAQQLDDLLAAFEFAPVAAVGQPFRASEHEAVGESPAREGAPAGTIAEVVQQGYRFAGGLLRPAKVLVAGAAAGAAGPTEPVEPAEAGPAAPPSSDAQRASESGG